MSEPEISFEGSPEQKSGVLFLKQSADRLPITTPQEQDLPAEPIVLDAQQEIKEFITWLDRLDHLSFFNQNTLERLMTPKQHIGPPYLVQLEAKLQNALDEYHQLLDIFLIFEQLVTMIELKNEDYSLSLNQSIDRLATYHTTLYSHDQPLDSILSALLQDYNSFMAAKLNYAQYNTHLHELAQNIRIKVQPDTDIDSTLLIQEIQSQLQQFLNDLSSFQTLFKRVREQCYKQRDYYFQDHLQKFDETVIQMIFNNESMLNYLATLKQWFIKLAQENADQESYYESYYQSIKYSVHNIKQYFSKADSLIHSMSSLSPQALSPRLQSLDSLLHHDRKAFSAQLILELDQIHAIYSTKKQLKLMIQDPSCCYFLNIKRAKCLYFQDQFYSLKVHTKQYQRLIQYYLHDYTTDHEHIKKTFEHISYLQSQSAQLHDISHDQLILLYRSINLHHRLSTRFHEIINRIQNIFPLAQILYEQTLEYTNKYQQESQALRILQNDLQYYLKTKVLQVRQDIKNQRIFLMVVQQDLLDIKPKSLSLTHPQMVHLFKYDLDQIEYKSKSVLDLQSSLVNIDISQLRVNDRLEIEQYLIGSDQVQCDIQAMKDILQKHHTQEKISKVIQQPQARAYFSAVSVLQGDQEDEVWMD